MLGYRFQRDGKGTQGVEKTLLEKCFSENEMPAADQPCLQHCTKQHRELDMEKSQRTCGTSFGNKDPAIDIQTQDATWRRVVAYKVRTARMMRLKLKKMGLSSLAELCAEQVWKTMAWAVYKGEVLVLKALRSVVGWRTTAWWRNSSVRGMKMGPAERCMLEAQVGVP